MPLFPNIRVIPITYNENDKRNTDCYEIYNYQSNFIYLYNERWSSFIAETNSSKNGGSGNGKMAHSKSNIIDLYKYKERQKKIVIGLCTMSTNKSKNILHIYLAFTQLKYILIQTTNIFNRVFFSSNNYLLGFKAATHLGEENLSLIQTYVYFKLKQFFSFVHHGAKLKTYDNNDLKIIQDEENFLKLHIDHLTNAEKVKILKYDRKFAEASMDMLTYEYTRIFTDDFRITEFENYPLHPEISTKPSDSEFDHQIENAIIVDFIEGDYNMKIYFDCEHNTTKNTVYFKLKNVSMIKDYYNKILLHVLFNRIFYFIEKPNSKIDKITYPRDIISKIIIPKYNLDSKSVVKNLKTFFSVKLRQFFTSHFEEENPDITFITLENEILELNNTISREGLETDERLVALKENEQEFKLIYDDYFPAINEGGTINKFSFRKTKKNKITIFI